MAKKKMKTKPASARAKSTRKASSKAKSKSASRPQKAKAPRGQKVGIQELAEMKMLSDLAGINMNHGPEQSRGKSKGRKGSPDRATSATIKAKTSITGRKGTAAQPGRDDIGNRGH